MPGTSAARRRTFAPAVLLCAGVLTCGQVQAHDDHLRSWNDGPAKKAIIEFVEATTHKGSPGIKTKFEMRDGKAVLVRLPELNFIDDRDGKPVGINEHIGRRPTAAFGNSDGDRQMLEYATTGSGVRFGMLVLHDDPAREFAYGPAHGLPDSRIGSFSQSLYDEARQRNWLVVSIKDDWKQVFRSGH